jgi:hypothetical protein
MSAWRRMPLGLTLAVLGVALAALVAGVALWRALALAPLPAARVAVTFADGAAPSASAATGGGRLLATLAADPFAPTRRRPAERFRLPQDGGGGHHRATDGADRLAAVRVIGTAVLPDGGGFAICQRAGGPALLVRLGGTLGDWTLTAVEPSVATFVTAAGATLVVRVLKSGGGS